MCPYDGPNIISTIEIQPDPVSAGSKRNHYEAMLTPRDSKKANLTDPVIYNENIFKSTYSKIFPTPKSYKGDSLLLLLSPEVTRDQIIYYETKSLKKPERKATYKTALECIARNDFIGFEKVLPSLLKAFGINKIEDFKNDFVDCYIFKFMILFGADNFIEKYGIASCALFIRIPGLFTIEIFKYLIETSPINTVLSILSGFNAINIDLDMRAEIQKIINEKHPELDCFKKILVKTIGSQIGGSAWKAFLAEISEVEKFKLISKVIGKFYSAIAIFETIDLLISRPDSFLQCSEVEKFQFAKAVIRLDNLERLQELINLDPMIVMSKEENATFSYLGCPELNIIDISITRRASNCFIFLIQILPELALLKNEFESNSMQRLVNSTDQKLFEAFIETIGLDPKFSFKYKEYDNMNLVSYAFYIENGFALNYFIQKLGVKGFKEAIKPCWSNDNEILGFLLENWRNVRLQFVLERLEIDPSGPFTYKGRTGDVSIFFGPA